MDRFYGIARARRLRGSKLSRRLLDGRQRPRIDRRDSLESSEPAHQEAGPIWPPGIWHSCGLLSNPATKRFRNCLSYEAPWQEEEGSEDSHGRALWGLGTVLGRSKDAGLRGAAGRMFELAVPAALEFKSPRACAFALLGVLEYLDSFPGDRAALSASDALANRLLNSYRANRTDDWKWFESGLAYSNAVYLRLWCEPVCAPVTREMVTAGSRRFGLARRPAALRSKRPFRAYRLAGLLFQDDREGSLRPAACRSLRGVSACLQAYRATGKGPLAQRSLVCIQLVLGRQRSADRALRPPLPADAETVWHPRPR